MSFVAVGAGIVAAGGAIAGAVITSNATKDAANTQANAAQNATNVQEQEFNQIQANNAPWMQAGQTALSGMQGMTANPQTFTQADLTNGLSPSYNFELAQGNQAIQRSAAANGGLQTGGTMKAMAQYTQGMASTGYQQAYNNFMNNQNTQFGRLATIAGYGSGATNNTNAAGVTTAQNVGNNIMGAGNAEGAAQIAGGQAWGNALSSVGGGIGKGMMGGAMLNNANPYAIGAGGMQIPQYQPQNQTPVQSMNNAYGIPNTGVYNPYGSGNGQIGSVPYGAPSSDPSSINYAPYAYQGLGAATINGYSTY